jgi:alpha/beta superfamily hydrolase
MTHEKLPAVSPDTIPELAARGPQPAWQGTIHECLIIAVAVALGALMFCTTGCAAFRTAGNVLGDLATGAGELAAVKWVAAAHPSTNEQQAVALGLADATAAIGNTNAIVAFNADVAPLAALAIDADPRIPILLKPLAKKVVADILADADRLAVRHSKELKPLEILAQFGTDFLSGAASALGGGQ